MATTNCLQGQSRPKREVAGGSLQNRKGPDVVQPPNESRSIIINDVKGGVILREERPECVCQLGEENQ